MSAPALATTGEGQGGRGRKIETMSTMNYNDFLHTKSVSAPSVGFEVNKLLLPKAAFEWQNDIIEVACRKGRFAIFSECGTGKTLMELGWGVQVVEHTNGMVLLVAPCGVAEQIVFEEAPKFGVEARLVSEQIECERGINVTNYEKLHRFELGIFSGVILDESSILKSFDGKTRNQIVEGFSQVPYRLPCSATPSPNDYMELGNHSEFLGVMSRAEMLAMFFVHDGGDTSKWRLKGHAEDEFWKWVCSWAVMLRKPSDLGYSDEGFELPPLHLHQHTVGTMEAAEGQLFATEAQTLTERRAARKNSLEGRAEAVAATVGVSDEQWLVWCDRNDEQDLLEKLLGDRCVSIRGTTPADDRLRLERMWREGRVQTLVTKPGMFGFGMNWQHCHNEAFCGLSDSYEQFYQAVRRCWRYGQAEPVNCHIFTSPAEGAVVKNIERKEQDAQKMAAAMVEHLSQHGFQSVRRTEREGMVYRRDVRRGDAWTAHLGDCVEVVREMEPNSIDYSVFSPPFASLYTYSNSERDMGNCRTHGEFYEHFQFLTKELFRVLKPGRLLSFHCMNLPTSKERDGFIGISDFRGDLIRIFRDAGFIFHSEVVIWKDPVTAMQRTKALGLLYKQLKKDSCMSRQGIPDYLITMRKPGENPDPVTKQPDDFPVSLWQNYASPVWMDINPSDTLQKESAREEKDERHICPLQLEVIRRAIRLWTNPGDTVLSPFGGIGSEGYVAVEMGRKAVTVELKESYWRQGVLNLQRAESAATQAKLFEGLFELAA